MENLNRATLLKAKGEEWGTGGPRHSADHYGAGSGHPCPERGEGGQGLWNLCQVLGHPLPQGNGRGCAGPYATMHLGHPHVYQALKVSAFRVGLPRPSLTLWSNKIIMAYLRSSQRATLQKCGPALDPQVMWANVTSVLQTNKKALPG